MSSNRLYCLDHCLYRCEYHLVWIPKYRGKVLADKYIKQLLRNIFKQIAKWKDLKIYAWHIGDEHIHLFVSVPPKFSIAYVVGILKGKSSAWLKKKTKKIPPGSFWGRGYFVTTVGINEIAMRKYVENQQHHQVDLPKLPL